jgi:hypothetical protein
MSGSAAVRATLRDSYPVSNFEHVSFGTAENEVNSRWLKSPWLQ